MPHFFVKSTDKNNNLITISDNENYRHIARALRARVGESLLLIDENQIQYETIINAITNSEIICEIQKFYPSKRDLDFDLYLAQSPLRSDAQLTVMEKATELGARGVFPVVTDNCALAQSVLAKKHEKWQKVMFEACKQCERSKVPTCFEPTVLEEVLKQDFDKILVLAERSTEITLKEFLTQNPIKKGEKVLAIIGPEGGFSQREFDYFKSKNLLLISLGDLILKAETAVIVTLGNIVYEYQG
ncbi:MAG: 16S rRNA (uracil(1498)-N(3))-methyltransferase [Candidatus Gastranaerophilales bacterium]|nr:16S rRNA (uracil(1498)-N(3))-methyltransferase [Candidatus Gastranaerophilales bacterium]MCM1073322.1 16S rRNA (uracil(1498)-N(3))-methyltransferase [Bacteroides sp.]